MEEKDSDGTQFPKKSRRGKMKIRERENCPFWPQPDSRLRIEIFDFLYDYISERDAIE